MPVAEVLHSHTQEDIVAGDTVVVEAAPAAGRNADHGPYMAVGLIDSHLLRW